MDTGESLKVGEIYKVKGFKRYSDFFKITKINDHGGLCGVFVNGRMSQHACFKVEKFKEILCQTT